MIERDYHGKRVVIAGLGRTATALAALLKREGADVFVSEFGPAARVAESIAALERIGVPYETDGHSEARFRACDIVTPSPGVSPAIAPITQAIESGARLMGEMECAWPFLACPILAVTGTNGKTTTTELLAAMLRGAGYRVILAGNNAVPLSQAVLDGGAPDYAVVEVSSYQLETAQTFRPLAAAVLNVTPDHLARHGTLEGYAAAKARIFANQTEADTAVINGDDPLVLAMASDARARVIPFSTRHTLDNGLWYDGASFRFGDAVVADSRDFGLRGRHNLQNALAALALASAATTNWSGLAAGMRSFPGVEHRIEFVAEIGGVRYYNDSKSTNTDSLAVALDSFSEPVILIAGGQGKGAGYSMLRDRVAARVKRLVSIGEDAPLLEETFGPVTPTERAVSMSDAVNRAAAHGAPGDAVVLSPACASFDMYRNFEERGRDFKACVARLKETAP